MVKTMIRLIIFFCLLNLFHGAPIEMVTVDLTHTLENDIPKYPIVKSFNMRVVVNGSTELTSWMQSEDIESSTHVGTHMDAPSHFVQGGLNIDQIPVSKFIAPAAVINIANKAAEDPDAAVTVEDLANWEKMTGKSLNGMVILVNSGWGKKWKNTAEYLGTSENDPRKLHFPGISREAAQWLVDNRDINGVGLDTVSIDRGNAMDFPAHNIILGKGIFALENVANIEKIPTYGAMLYVLPMKIGRASAASARVVATFPKVIYNQGRDEYCTL